MLKQPLQTQVSLSTGELDGYRLDEGIHIHISLRDFKVTFSYRYFAHDRQLYLSRKIWAYRFMYRTRNPENHVSFRSDENH